MIRTIGAVLAIGLALTGCAATAVETPAAEVPVVQPTAMSVTEAGEYYLAALCDANDAMDANYLAFESGDEAEIASTAVVAMEAAQTAAVRLGDTSLVWPDGVADDLALVRDSFIDDAATYDAISTAADLAEMQAVPFADITEAQEASQRIRALLELPADTYEGC